MKELDEFVELQRTRDTRKRYSEDNNELLKYYNIDTLEKFLKLDLVEITKYRNHLAEDRGNCESTIATKFRSISSFYTFLIDVKGIPMRNFAKIVSRKLKPVNKKQRTYLTSQQAIDFLTACKNKRDYAIMMIFLNNGLRISELIGIKLSDYDKEHKQIKVNRKGTYNAYISLSDCVIEAIEDYLPTRKDSKYDNLFISNSFKPMTIPSINKTIKKLTRHANINVNISAHSLRRTLATDLKRDGYEIEDIKNVLGHKNIATTVLYIQSEEEDAKRVINAHTFSAR